MAQARKAFQSVSELPDLSLFEGKSLEEAEEMLKSLGYEKCTQPRLASSIWYGPCNDHMIRLHPEPALARKATEFYKQNPNKHFPRIYHHGTASMTLHVTVMERLKLSCEIEEQDRRTLCGHMRAAATYITGDRQTAVRNDRGKGNHDSAHALMHMDQDFRNAAHAIMDFIGSHLRSDRRDSYPIFDDSRKKIWLRENGGGHDMVFFESLTHTEHKSLVLAQLGEFRRRMAEHIPAVLQRDFGMTFEPAPAVMQMH